MIRVICAVFGLLMSAAAVAVPVTIDFDDLGSGVTVGSHYASSGVTFVDAVTNSYGTLPGGSAPTGISHATSGYRPQPSNPIEAIFSAVVSTVSLSGLDVGQNGFVMNAYDAISGGSLVDTATIFGSSSAGVGEFFTLTLTGGIRRIEFSQVQNVYGDGVVFDNLVFDTAVSVPEPATWLMLMLGLLGVRVVRRA